MKSNLKSANDVLTSQEVIKYLPYNCKWWSKYIYHYSHVVNIAAILNDRMLYSRANIGRSSLFEMNMELNDNASAQVIEGTEEEFKNYVRFYFRPLTPTQYHNEGIISKQEMTELCAHCPVPIFLMFDNSILNEDYVEFSYESLATQGKYIDIYSSISELEKAPIELIYHNYPTNDQQIRKHRHAEIIVKEECDLRYLSKIVCRSEAEKQTLMALLNQPTRVMYEDIIVTVDSVLFEGTNINQMFYDTRLRIDIVTLKKDSLRITFNKRDEIKNIRSLQIKCFDKNGNLICKHFSNEICFYNMGRIVNFKMYDKLKNHKEVTVGIDLDDKIVYYNHFVLAD